MTQAVRCMVREEGLRSLWKGHVSAQILSIGFGIVEVYLVVILYVISSHASVKVFPSTGTYFFHY